MSINNIGCGIRAGYRLNLLCNSDKSGIKEVFIVPFSWLATDGIIFDSNDQILVAPISASNLWYKFDQVVETAEYDEKSNEDKFGNHFWEQNLTLVFHRNRANLRKQMLQLFNSKQLVAIFHTNDDRYFLCGKDRGLDINANVKVEKSYGGLNGQIIQLKGLEKYPAYEIVGSAITYSSTVISREQQIEEQSPIGGA